MTEENKKEEYDFKNWTVKELREFASANNITIPSGSRKNDIIELLSEIVAYPEFVDRTKEENLEEEIIAGFDEDEDDTIGYKREPAELKFWQKPPFSTLLNVELAKESDVAFYDLASLVEKFFDKMLHEDLINFKVSGIALKTSASLHHHKISSVIKEEEQIQKKEKLEEMRQRTRRKIPKTLSQPIKPKLKMTSQDDLFDAMRAAIIDTMQKKEKLKRRRLKREEKKRRRRQEKSKAKLPKEILKHITGDEQTVEELHESWYNRIRATLGLENNDFTSFEDMMKLVKEDEKELKRLFEIINR